MSDTGKQSPLGVNVNNSLLTNQGMQINPKFASWVGFSTNFPTYAFGRICQETCLRLLTHAINQGYYGNFDGIPYASVYNNLISIGGGKRQITITSIVSGVVQSTDQFYFDVTFVNSPPVVLTPGQYIRIDGANPNGYNGNWIISTILEANKFRINSTAFYGPTTSSGSFTVDTQIPALGNAKPLVYTWEELIGPWGTGTFNLQDVKGWGGSLYKNNLDAGNPTPSPNTANPATQWAYIRLLALQAWMEWNYNSTQQQGDNNNPAGYRDFLQSFQNSYGFIEYSNDAILPNDNSKDFLDGAFSSMNDLITADITNITLAVKIWGQDLIKLGKAIDLSNIDYFGLPSVLLKNLAKNNALTKNLSLAIVSAGIPVDELGAILSNIVQPTVLQERKLYATFVLTVGDALKEILIPLNCKTAGLESLADLLNLKKLFPDSYPALTVPLYQDGNNPVTTGAPPGPITIPGAVIKTKVSPDITGIIPTIIYNPPTNNFQRPVPGAGWTGQIAWQGSTNTTLTQVSTDRFVSKIDTSTITVVTGNKIPITLPDTQYLKSDYENRPNAGTASDPIIVGTNIFPSSTWYPAMTALTTGSSLTWPNSNYYNTSVSGKSYWTLILNQEPSLNNDATHTGAPCKSQVVNGLNYKVTDNSGSSITLRTTQTAGDGSDADIPYLAINTLGSQALTGRYGDRIFVTCDMQTNFSYGWGLYEFLIFLRLPNGEKKNIGFYLGTRKAQDFFASRGTTFPFNLLWNWRMTGSVYYPGGLFRFMFPDNYNPLRGSGVKEIPTPSVSGTTYNFEFDLDDIIRVFYPEYANSNTEILGIEFSVEAAWLGPVVGTNYSEMVLSNISAYKKISDTIPAFTGPSNAVSYENAQLNTPFGDLYELNWVQSVDSYSSSTTGSKAVLSPYLYFKDQNNNTIAIQFDSYTSSFTQTYVAKKQDGIYYVYSYVGDFRYNTSTNVVNTTGNTNVIPYKLTFARFNLFQALSDLRAAGIAPSNLNVNDYVLYSAGIKHEVFPSSSTATVSSQVSFTNLTVERTVFENPTIIPAPIPSNLSNSKIFYLIYTQGVVNAQLLSSNVVSQVGIQIPSRPPLINDTVINNVVIQEPARGFGSYLSTIVPPEIAITAGAFSVAMQQIRNIKSVNFEKFAQVVTNLETMASPGPADTPITLNTNTGTANNVPTNLILRRQGLPLIALGSGPQGSYTMSDFFGCVSGLPYTGNSRIVRPGKPDIPERGLEGIYNKIVELQGCFLALVYLETYLAVTWERAKGAISQNIYFKNIQAYAPPVYDTDETSPTYGEIIVPAIPRIDEWYYTVNIGLLMVGGGYGRGNAPTPEVSLYPNNCKASMTLTIGTNSAEVPGRFGRTSVVRQDNGKPYLYEVTEVLQPDPPPPPTPPEEWIEIQAPPIANLAVFKPCARSQDGRNVPGYAISSFGNVKPGIWYWPKGGNSPGMNSVISAYIIQANGEIDEIYSTKNGLARLLNNYWNSTGSQLTIEQRARWTGLKPPLSLTTRDNYLSLFPSTQYNFTDTVPSYAQNVEPHMYSQTLENIANWDTPGGLSLVAMMRQDRNQNRLTQLGIELDNNIPSTLPYEQQRILITNGSLPTGTSNSNIPSGSVLPAPSPGPSAPSPTPPATPVVIRDSSPITPNPLGVIDENGDFIVIDVEYDGGPIVPIEYDDGGPIVPGSFAGSPYRNLLPPNLNAWYTASTLMPSTYSVQEAIEEVIRCNCDCWELA